MRTKELILAKNLEQAKNKARLAVTEHKSKVSRTRHKNKLRCTCYLGPVIF